MKPTVLHLRAPALLLALVLFSAGRLAAARQYHPPADYVQLGKPDQAEGAKILAQFHQFGIVGDYYLGFELRVLPRRGAERVERGQLWGSRNSRGPISRVSLFMPAANGVPAEQRLLVQNGPQPAVWSWRSAEPGRVDMLGADALFAPLAQTDLTAFDLQMPFLYWTDFTYEGVVRLRDRPAHAFLMRPPAAISAADPALTGVRIWLDTQFNALVQAEYLGADGKPLKSITVLDLKKIGDQWIVKSIDVRNDATRNKTRFVVTAAALNLNFLDGLFDPAGLTASIQPPAGGQLAVFDTP